MQNEFLMLPQRAAELCGFPERLHPASQLILDNYLTGQLATHEFLRFFSLPNSDYIPLAACFVGLLTGG